MNHETFIELVDVLDNDGWLGLHYVFVWVEGSPKATVRCGQ